MPARARGREKIPRARSAGSRREFSAIETKACADLTRRQLLNALLGACDIVAQRIDFAHEALDVMPRCDQRLLVGPVRGRRARDAVRSLQLPVFETAGGLHHAMREDVAEDAAQGFFGV